MDPQKAQRFAIASLVLGILSLVLWVLPICCGTPFVVLAGGLFGFFGLSAERRAIAIIGLVLNGIGALLIVLNVLYGAYLGATGQHPFIQPPLEPAAPNAEPLPEAP